MRILVVKTSSMGDVLHTLPAITDALEHDPTLQFDWIVEPGFAEIPAWHPGVKNIYHVPLRRWRKQLWKKETRSEMWDLIRSLRSRSYDFIIDAQGLIKSAWLTRFAKGKRVGLDFASAREPFASLAYQQSYRVAKNQHAVTRLRQLFAQALSYNVPDRVPHYGIDTNRLAKVPAFDNALVFLHGTTWPSKHWPESNWQQLADLACQAGYQVLLPWGNEEEHRRAHSIRRFVEAKSSHSATHLPHVLHKLSLSEITAIIAQATGAVAVDTGLGHVAAAMGTPTVSIYGSTDPHLTGAMGPKQHHLRVEFECSPCLLKQCKHLSGTMTEPPCYASLSPQRVWHTLLRDLHENHR